MQALVDTKAVKTIISRSTAQKCGIFKNRKEYVIKPDVRGVNSVLELKEYIPEVTLEFKEKNVVVNPAVMDTREFQLLLG